MGSVAFFGIFLFQPKQSNLNRCAVVSVYRAFSSIKSINSSSMDYFMLLIQVIFTHRQINKLKEISIAIIGRFCWTNNKNKLTNRPVYQWHKQRNDIGASQTRQCCLSLKNLINVTGRTSQKWFQSLERRNFNHKLPIGSALLATDGVYRCPNTPPTNMCIVSSTLFPNFNVSIGEHSNKKYIIQAYCCFWTYYKFMSLLIMMFQQINNSNKNNDKQII